VGSSIFYATCKQITSTKKTKDDRWREKEELHLEREEERKAREEERKEQEHLFSQWEPIQMNIQQLSAALSMDTNDLLKHDIQGDILVLINRKNMLVNKSNLN